MGGEKIKKDFSTEEGIFELLLIKKIPSQRRTFFLQRPRKSKSWRILPKPLFLFFRQRLLQNRHCFFDGNEIAWSADKRFLE